MAGHDAVVSEHLSPPLDGIGHGNGNNDSSLDFAEKSYLTYCVPTQTDLNLDEAFKDIESGRTFLEDLKKRTALFFGTSHIIPTSH